MSVASIAASGDVTVTGDVNAAGGFRKQFAFFSSGTFANTNSVMVFSEIGGQNFTKFPLMGTGSLVKFSLYSQDLIVAGGAITGTVCVNDVKTELAIIVTSGSYSGYDSATKDVVTFTTLQPLTVTLTASADYVCSSTHSGSWLAVVEMES